MALVALEVVTVDATIIGDPAPYHLPVPYPPKSRSFVLVNTNSINENPSFARSTVPFTSLSSYSKFWNIEG